MPGQCCVFQIFDDGGRTTNGTTKAILPGDQGCRARAVRTPVLRSLLTRCAKRFAGLSCVWRRSHPITQTSGMNLVSQSPAINPS